MQHAALVLSLEKAALQSIKTQLLLLQKRQTDSHRSNPHESHSTVPFSGKYDAKEEEDGSAKVDMDLYDNDLTAVKFEHFALTLLDHMNNMIKMGERNQINISQQLYTQTTSFFLQMTSIIAVFDAVDIDSRGVIVFNDFVDFCLRLGRLLLKPSIKSSFSTYLQYEGSKGSLYPSHKIRYFSPLNCLFVLDTEAPRVRMYRRDGRFFHKMNPVAEAKRLLRHSGLQKTTYYEKSNYEKEFSNMKSIERDFDETKGHILDCSYVDSLKQLIFSSTHSYLFFMDATLGFKENGIHLSKKDDMFRIQHFVKTKFPLYGLYYSSILNILVGFPGEGSDHFFEIYDPATRSLKYQITKHDTKILCLCELILDKAHPTKDHYFVSASMDKKVIMWPTAPMSTLVGQSQTKRLLRVADIMDFELRGHGHAIQSLAYAYHNEILFGCGFDFEVIAWDPFSRDIIMKFVGHFKSLAGVQIAYIPEEKLLSLDEAGVLKVWNINKDLGIYGNQESSVTLHCSQPANIKDFILTNDRGKGVAILAEKVYYLNVETDVIEEVKPVTNGFGFCPTAGRAFTIFRSTIHLFDMNIAKKVKKIPFLDPDRISSSDEIVSQNEELRMGAPLKPVSSFSAANPDDATHQKGGAHPPPHSHQRPEESANLKYFSHIDIRDVITAVAMDGHGKKVFLGTRDGRVLLFDSFTFGLVKQLTVEVEDAAFLMQGSISALHYVDRDELLVALWDNGAVKVYSGCLRTALSSSLSGVGEEEEAEHQEAASASAGRHPNSNKFAFYGATGGKAPPKPSLLREIDLGYTFDHSVKGLAVSVDHNLVATLSKTGFIFLYDYLTLDFLACLSMDDDAPAGENLDQSPSLTIEEKGISFLFIEFLPSVPILLVADNHHRVTAWGVKSMNYRYLLRWNIYEDVLYNNRKEENTFYQGFDFQGATPVTMSIPTFANQNHPQISSLKSYSFFAMNDSSKDILAAATSAAAVVTNTKISFAKEETTSTSSHQTSTKKKSLPIIHTASQEQRWILFLSTEDGLVLTQNLTALVEKSGADEHLVRNNHSIHYPVYNKMKPKRFKIPHVDYPSQEHFPRLKLSEEWLKKILSPIKRHQSIQDNLAMEPAVGSISSMPAGSVMMAPTAHSHISFSGTVRVAKLVKSGTNRKHLRNFQRMMKKVKLDEAISVYIEGLFTWFAFSRQGIRALQFYNPSLDYSSVQEFQQLFSSDHPGSGRAQLHQHHAQLSPISANLPFEISAQYNRLPLLATLSDQGNIRLWTFTGVYLGQNQADDIGLVEQSTNNNPRETMLSSDLAEEEEDPNYIEEDHLATEDHSLKSSMFHEILNMPDIHAASTFVMKLEETETEDPSVTTATAAATTANGLSRNQRSTMLERKSSLAPKIYVKNERTMKLTTKRLSVMAKEYPSTIGSQGSTKNPPPLSSPFHENTLVTNPQLTSTFIIQSFLQYQHQLTNEVNAYEQYPIEHARLQRQRYGASSIWSFPQISLALPNLSLSQKEKEYFPMEDSRMVLSYVQYHFYLSIVLQIVNLIQHDINALYLDKIGYFDMLRLQQKTASGSGLMATAAAGRLPKAFASQKAKLYRKISNYATRFQSMENLLKGIDSYLITSSIQHQQNYRLLSPASKKRPQSAKTASFTSSSVMTDHLQKEMEKKKQEIEDLLLYSVPAQSKYNHDYEEQQRNQQLMKYIISGLTENEIQCERSAFSIHPVMYNFESSTNHLDSGSRFVKHSLKKMFQIEALPEALILLSLDFVSLNDRIAFVSCNQGFFRRWMKNRIRSFTLNDGIASVKYCTSPIYREIILKKIVDAYNQVDLEFYARLNPEVVLFLQVFPVTSLRRLLSHAEDFCNSFLPHLVHLREARIKFEALYEDIEDDDQEYDGMNGGSSSKFIEISEVLNELQRRNSPSLPNNLGLKSLKLQEGQDLEVFPFIPFLEEIHLQSFRSLKNFDAQYWCSSLSFLRCLHLTKCEDLVDVSMFDHLHTLQIINCKNVYDISKLNHNYRISIGSCEKISDYSQSFAYSTIVCLDLPNKSCKVDFSKCQRLQHLELYRNSLTSKVELSSLAVLPPNTKIFYNNDFLSPLELSLISQLSHLHQVILDRCPHIANVDGLGNVPVVVLMRLEHLTSIRALGQKNKSVVILGCHAIKDFTSLRNVHTVKIGNCKGLLRVKACLDQVKFLTITSCAQLTSLAGLKQAEFLHVSQCSKLKSLEGVDGAKTLELELRSPTDFSFISPQWLLTNDKIKIEIDQSLSVYASTIEEGLKVFQSYYEIFIVPSARYTTITMFHKPNL